jgi:hypothetical protein
LNYTNKYKIVNNHFIFLTKGVLTGACVDQKIVQSFGCFDIDIYDCVLTTELGAHSVNIIIIIFNYFKNYLIILTFSLFF